MTRPQQAAAMTPVDLLFTQGFGSRRECRARIDAGQLVVNGRVIAAGDSPLALNDGDLFVVDSQPWPYHRRALVMLHKPAGAECSARPQAHPSVLSLLPAPLRQRGVQPIGRLDADTTGLLLLTDDGALNHRLSSPRHHVEKVYDVRCAHPVTPALIRPLLEGVELRDAPNELVRALACSILGDHTVQLTIDEGRYHQVKRMIAAAGNRVTELHRSKVGELTLPSDLAPGAWAFVDPSRVDPRTR